MRVYTLAEKREVVAAWLVTGSSKKAAAITGIDAGIIRQWTKQKWWDAAVDEVRNEHMRVFECKLQALIDKSTRELVDRLDNGEEVVVRGEIHRVRIGARAAANILALAFNQQRLIRNQPTRISSDDGLQHLEALEKRLRGFAEMDSVKVIEAHRVDDGAVDYRYGLDKDAGEPADDPSSLPSLLDSAGSLVCDEDEEGRTVIVGKPKGLRELAEKVKEYKGESGREAD